MSGEDKRPGRRSEPRVWLYTEHWLWGSTRSELTLEERAIFIDLLCLGITGMGKVDITYPDQTADQLRVPRDVFNSTVKKGVQYEKFTIKRDKRRKKTFLCILNWTRYQPEYLHSRPEKPVRKWRSAKGGKCDAHVDPREERRGEEVREGEVREEKRSGGPPSKLKTEFFNLLRSLSGPSYPFQENEDGQVFDLFAVKYPKVNIIEQTEKKVEYWRENPSALRAHKKGPRTQLVDWLLGEAEYQDGQK